MLGAGRRLLWHGFLLLLVTSLLWVALFLTFSMDQRNRQLQQQQQQRRRRPLALSNRPTDLGAHKDNTSQPHLAQNARLMLGAHGKDNTSQPHLPQNARLMLGAHGKGNISADRSVRNISVPHSAEETDSPSSTYSFRTPASSNVSEHRRTRENATATPDILSSARSIASAVKVLPPERYLLENASFFALRKEVVNQFKARWRIQSPCPAPGPFLLVIVPSVSGHRAQRTAIRRTWASQAYTSGGPAGSGQPNSTVKIIFFLGMTSSLNRSEVLSEAREFRDIVVGDFVDTYRNLSLKMALALQWVHERCAEASYVVKVDEDTFVHLPLLLGVLKSLPARFSNFVLGRSRSVHVLPAVSRVGRWAVSRQAYPLPHWPQYLYGHSYVMSRQAVASLRHASHHMPLIVNEDAYVTGVLAKSGAVQRLHSNHFAVLNNDDDRCLLVLGKAVSQTGVPFTTLYSVWQAVQSGNCSLVYEPVLVVLESPTD